MTSLQTYDRNNVWLDTISALSVRLSGVSISTEKEFLSIGGKLHDFCGQVDELAAHSCAISALITGEETGSAINGLNGIIERLSGYLSGDVPGKTGKSVVLRNIKGTLDAIDKPLHGYTLVHNTLKSLSLSIKIESARLCGAAAGFSLLAEEVSALSVQVRDKVSGIFEKKSELTTTICGALDLAGKIGAGQIEDIGKILGKTRNAVETLNGVNCRCATALDLVATSATEVSRNVGGVVTSLQYHDIVRQQIEHVSDSLRELGTRLAAYKDNNLLETCGIYTETFHVCTLQSAQLCHARDGFTHAVGQIIESLIEVERRQASIADASRNAVGSGTDNNSFFTDLQNGLMSLTTMLADSIMKNRDLATLVESLTTAVTGIGGIVAEIRTIGEDIKLIALNARIKAFRAGSEGAGIGVLADAVKGLSLDAMKQSKAVSALLQAVIDGTDELCTETDTLISVLESEVKEISAEIARMLKVISQVNSNLSRSLKRMDNIVHTLSADISATTDGMSSHVGFEAVVGDAIVQLDRIAAEARNQNPVGCALPVTDSSWWLSGRYTMQSQRVVHASVTGTGLSSLSTGDSGADKLASKGKTVQSGSELGDNVELF